MHYCEIHLHANQIAIKNTCNDIWFLFHKMIYFRYGNNLRFSQQYTANISVRHYAVIRQATNLINKGKTDKTEVYNDKNRQTKVEQINIKCLSIKSVTFM